MGKPKGKALPPSGSLIFALFLAITFPAPSYAWTCRSQCEWYQPDCIAWKQVHCSAGPAPSTIQPVYEPPREQQIREEQIRQQQMREQQMRQEQIRQQQMREQQMRQQQLLQEQIRCAQPFSNEYYRFTIENQTGNSVIYLVNGMQFQLNPGFSRNHSFPKAVGPNICNIMRYGQPLLEFDSSFEPGAQMKRYRVGLNAIESFRQSGTAIDLYH
jgi:TolA-binding protein